MAKKNAKKVIEDLIELLWSNRFEWVQQVDGGDEEPHEGCINNMIVWLESGEAKVSVFEATDPQARDNSKTYKVEIPIWENDYVVTIWEI